MSVRRLFYICLLLSLVGCAKAPTPTAGGKPIGHWLQEAKNSDPKTRAEAIEKLGNIGKKSPSAIEAVVQALSDTDPKVRKIAIYAVVRNRSSCQPAFPKLKELSEKDESPEIRSLAAEAHHNLVR